MPTTRDSPLAHPLPRTTGSMVGKTLPTRRPPQEAAEGVFPAPLALADRGSTSLRVCSGETVLWVAQIPTQKPIGTEILEGVRNKMLELLAEKDKAKAAKTLPE